MTAENTPINKQWRLKERPTGKPSRDTWDYTETEVPSIGDGEILIRIDYISLILRCAVVKRCQILH